MALDFELNAMVKKYGARYVAESLVEVFYDRAGDSAKGNRTNEQLRWLRLAVSLGATVHHGGLDWPS